MKNINKKLIIDIIIAVILIATIIFAALFVLNSINNSANNKTSNPGTISNERADAIKTQATQAEENNDTSGAVTLYQEARQIYLDTNNMDSVADIDAKLYKITHKAPTPTPTSPVKIGSN